MRGSSPRMTERAHHERQSCCPALSRRRGAVHSVAARAVEPGVAIGALTFTGSVIAFAKLSGRMSGAPIILPARHVINIALALALVFFIVGLVLTGSALDFWLITIIALALGALLIIPIGGADMPV